MTSITKPNRYFEVQFTCLRSSNPSEETSSLAFRIPHSLVSFFLLLWCFLFNLPDSFLFYSTCKRWIKLWLSLKYSFSFSNCGLHFYPWIQLPLNMIHIILTQSLQLYSRILKVAASLIFLLGYIKATPSSTWLTLN